MHQSIQRVRDGKKIFFPEAFTGTSPFQTSWPSWNCRNEWAGDGPCSEKITGRKIDAIVVGVMVGTV